MRREGFLCRLGGLARDVHLGLEMGLLHLPGLSHPVTLTSSEKQGFCFVRVALRQHWADCVSIYVGRLKLKAHDTGNCSSI